MWLAAASEDPVRVIVEHSSGGWFSTWGPLVGVAVGALLAGLFQFLTGRAAHKRERAAEDRALRRDTYIAFDRAVDDEIYAWVRMQARQLVLTSGPLEADSARHREARERRYAAEAALGFIAPTDVHAIASRLGRALSGLKDGQKSEDEVLEEVKWIPRLQHDVVTAMRKELGVAGEPHMAPSTKETGPVPEDYPPSQSQVDEAWEQG